MGWFFLFICVCVSDILFSCTCNIIQLFLLVACAENLITIWLGQENYEILCILGKIYYCGICSFYVSPICGSVYAMRNSQNGWLAFFVEANLSIGKLQIERVVSFAKEMHNYFMIWTLLFTEQILLFISIVLSHLCCFSIQMLIVFKKTMFVILFCVM
jgi:hypothetical protein